MKPQLLKATAGEIWGRHNWRNIFRHADISSLVVIRVFYGLIMLWEVYRYFAENRIYRYWIAPEFNFKYWPFTFAEPLPGDGMFILFYIMGALSICITLGLFYRVAAALFWLCFTYMFLLEASNYLNHFYLVSIFSFVMIFVPAHRSFSLDALIFKKIRAETVPVWSVWIVRFMIGLPYFFGGIAKITPDWLRGEPLAGWLYTDESIPIIGRYLGERWMTTGMSYAGLILDLFIVPALLWKRTRLISFILITSFHLFNSQLFSIGIFPWFMIGATTIYFDPDWPRNLVNKLRPKKPIWPIQLRPDSIMQMPLSLNASQKALTVGLVIWISVQVLLPFRHLAIPGNVHWTEEGHRWSWHMKLRSKTGEGIYTVKDKATGETQIIEPSVYLTERQERKMSGNPYLIWQFCQYIEEDYAKHGFEVEVYANVIASLNGRNFQQLIDPTVDLAAIPGPIIPHSPWIIPLTTPLFEN